VTITMLLGLDKNYASTIVIKGIIIQIYSLTGQPNSVWSWAGLQNYPDLMRVNYPDL